MYVDMDRLGIPFSLEEHILVDPNEESETGTVALDWWYPSPDGSMIAYGLSHLSLIHI